MRSPKRLLLPLAIGLVAATPFAVGGAIAAQGDATDPVRNVALPCELVHSPALPARASRNIVHLANVCGIVGTDIEFQSRKDLRGVTHDYAFVGTMGAGFRIFDITEPDKPSRAGGYVDSGWQNDIQVQGDIAVATFDGLAGEDSSASTCLKTRYPNASGQGVDIYRLNYNRLTAAFEVNLLTCVANPPGGAHNSTLHPSGEWLAISNPSSDWAVDVIDLRNVERGEAVHRLRIIDESKRGDATRCPAGATFTCVTFTHPDGSSARGLWRPHDVHFSRDGRTMYVAAVHSTAIVDVSRALAGGVKTIAVIPNSDGVAGDTPNDLAISHQADVSSDGKILVVGDERGGGVSETRCNTEPNGMMGVLHFWALGRVHGVAATKKASPANPVKLGIYVNPSPNRAPDPLAAAIAQLPRTERGCTVHVFRLGGNGTSSPGGNGVSTLGNRQLATAWYGAGVWHVDFAGRPSSTDGVAEDPRTTWGNTLGWNVMPGADTWSAKEYKGSIYAGDMLRGFDVYTIVRGDSSSSSEGKGEQARTETSVTQGVEAAAGELGVPAPQLPGLPIGTVGSLPGGAPLP